RHVRQPRGASQCGGEGRADSRRALARRRRLVLCGQRCGGFPEDPARVRYAPGALDEGVRQLRQAVNRTDIEVLYDGLPEPLIWTSISRTGLSTGPTEVTLRVATP